MKTHKTLATCFVFLFSLLLLGCDSLEKTSYQVLARTQAKHEVIQKYCSEAAIHNLIDEKQWNSFSVMSHTFIEVRNDAVDKFERWTRKKSKENEASLKAALLILPTVFQELEDFGKSCKQRLDTSESELEKAK